MKNKKFKRTVRPKLRVRTLWAQRNRNISKKRLVNTKLRATKTQKLSSKPKLIMKPRQGENKPKNSQIQRKIKKLNLIMIMSMAKILLRPLNWLWKI